MNREDFPILSTGLIYFDNGATTLKPKSVVEKMTDYYYNYPANIHRGDYKISLKASDEYEKVRTKVKNFINASSEDEIVFTEGATDSLNRVVFGFMEDYLTNGDEVIISKAEHASAVLPWLILARRKNIKVVFVPLEENHELSYTTLEKYITAKTKVISLAAVTNVIGDVRDINKIGKLCHDRDILFVVDGAQSVPHQKTDVIKDNIDFLTFSAHKMLGPTGVGVLYAKKEYLEAMRPIEYGGGMNQSFDSDGNMEFKTVPTRLEAGTPPIAEVIGLKEAILYINKIGVNKIHEHELKLKKYLIDEMQKIDNIILYNKTSDSGIVIFNIEGVFSQDTSVYLNYYNISIRAGNHCAKMLKDDLNIKNTCRVSMYIYNTVEDVDRLLEALRNSKDIFKIVI